MSRGKKMNGGKSNSRDNRQQEPASYLKALGQELYRRDCLKKKIAEGKMKDKNWKEADALGIKRPV